ncbi:CopD family protein [Massilia sp. H6]|uniref:CopD family protein n=1 Tax=Massilia sp. H6 TaxID=2970464 RepID=UPI0021674105|nr:CopD family protein [Massilia sp. H6]UVW27443.1 CopD family protein [Massilia sp. H6]
MDSVFGLQLGSVAALNAAFAWLAGSWLARRWLVVSGIPRASTETQLRPADLAAAVIGVLATAAMLWASTAVMGGVDLHEAKGLVWQMLTMTGIGRAGSIALFAICLALLMRTLRSTAAWREWVVLAALGLFALVRASMGHAGEDGYWTWPYLAQVVHLAAMAAWTGLVLVSACKAFDARLGEADVTRMARYLDAMSAAAMAAVAAVFATGVFNAWSRVGNWDNLLGDSLYANALLVKLALLAVALVLGGYNKFIGLPVARRSLAGLKRVRRVLILESVVLAGVLIAAAVLGSQQPPATM